MKCKAESCKNEAKARGYCVGHYSRVYRAGMDPKQADLSPLEPHREESRVEVFRIRVSPATGARLGAIMDHRRCSEYEAVREALEQWSAMMQERERSIP